MARRSQDAFDMLDAAYKAGLEGGRWANKSAFADYLDVAQGTASAWLHRRKKPALEYTFKLRDEFGIEPSLWPDARIVRAPSRAA